MSERVAVHADGRPGWIGSPALRAGAICGEEEAQRQPLSSRSLLRKPVPGQKATAAQLDHALTLVACAAEARALQWDAREAGLRAGSARWPASPQRCYRDGNSARAFFCSTAQHCSDCKQGRPAAVHGSHQGARPISPKVHRKEVAGAGGTAGCRALCAAVAPDHARPVHAVLAQSVRALDGAVGKGARGTASRVKGAGRRGAQHVRCGASSQPATHASHACSDSRPPVHCNSSPDSSPSIKPNPLSQTTRIPLAPPDNV